MSFRDYLAPGATTLPHNEGSLGKASLTDYIKFNGDLNRYTRTHLKDELKKIPFSDISNIASFFSTKGSRVQATSGVPVLAGVPNETNISLPGKISDSLVKLSKLCSESDYTMVLTNVSDIPANLGNVIEDIVELATFVIVAGFILVIVLPGIILCNLEDPEDPYNCIQAFEVDLENLLIDYQSKCNYTGADCIRDEVKKWATQLVTKVKDKRNGADTDITNDSNAEQLDYRPIQKPLKIYTSKDSFKFMKKPKVGETPSTTNYSYVTTTLPLGTDKWNLTLLTET